MMMVVAVHCREDGVLLRSELRKVCCEMHWREATVVLDDVNDFALVPLVKLFYHLVLISYSSCNCLVKVVLLLSPLSICLLLRRSVALLLCFADLHQPCLLRLLSLHRLLQAPLPPRLRLVQHLLPLVENLVAVGVLLLLLRLQVLLHEVQQMLARRSCKLRRCERGGSCCCGRG